MLRRPSAELNPGFSVQLLTLLPAVATPLRSCFVFGENCVLVLPLPLTILHRQCRVVCWEADSISKGQWLLPKAHRLFT